MGFIIFFPYVLVHSFFIKGAPVIQILTSVLISQFEGKGKPCSLNQDVPVYISTAS